MTRANDVGRERARVEEGFFRPIDLRIAIAEHCVFSLSGMLGHTSPNTREEEVREMSQHGEPV